MPYFLQPGQVSRRTVLIGGFVELRCPRERDTSEGPFPEARARHRGVIPKGARSGGAYLIALMSAFIIDEHRVLMGVVIEKVQAAESGLNESCISLIKGLEVSFRSF